MVLEGRFECPILIECLLCLGNIVVVLFAVEESLVLEVTPWVVLSRGNVLPHQLNGSRPTVSCRERLRRLSRLSWLRVRKSGLSRRCCLLMIILLLLGELERLCHWDVQSFQVVDDLIGEVVHLPDIALVHVVEEAHLGQRITRLDFVDPAHPAIEVNDFGLIWTGVALVLLGRPNRFAESLVRQVLDLVELAMLLYYLISQCSSLGGIRDQVLNPNFLSVLGAEVVPIDLCNVEEPQSLRLNLLFDLFFDFFACQ